MSGNPLIADFGISRTINSGEFPTLTTSSHNASGTLRWMARELIMGGEDDKLHYLAMDIWSYGMTVYVRAASSLPSDFF